MTPVGGGVDRRAERAVDAAVEAAPAVGVGGGELIRAQRQRRLNIGRQARPRAGPRRRAWPSWNWSVKTFDQPTVQRLRHRGPRSGRADVAATGSVTLAAPVPGPSDDKLICDTAATAAPAATANSRAAALSGGWRGHLVAPAAATAWPVLVRNGLSAVSVRGRRISPLLARPWVSSRAPETSSGSSSMNSASGRRMSWVTSDLVGR